MQQTKWLYTYAVMQLDSHPMYGHDKTIAVYPDKETAIKHAKHLSAAHQNICVVENKYASPENLRKQLTFNQSICWAGWL